jgi:hypothetical protein
MEKPDKVYLVWTGEYSSIEVKGVFLDGDEATEYAKDLDAIAGHEKSAWVDEMSIGRPDDGLGPIVSFWKSSINVFDGAIGTPRGAGKRYSCGSKVTHSPLIRSHPMPGMHHNLVSMLGEYILAESEVSQEHADKLVIEARQKMLREHDLSRFVRPAIGQSYVAFVEPSPLETDASQQSRNLET